MAFARYIEIAQQPAKLSLRNGCLIVAREAEPGVPEETSVPVGEVACVVLAHAQVYLTQPAMAALMAAGCPVLVCDGAMMPAGMMMPLTGNTLQSQRMQAQAAAPLPVRKRLWQGIVRWKVRAQASVLRTVHGNDQGLTDLAARVRSGDPTNVEAQAAARYWPALFGGDFRRRFDAPDQNRLLNYGYAVLRASVARATCGAGLHPTVGLHHRHRENPFCLADDLMEPYRPLVDGEVAEITGTWGPDAPLNTDAKRRLIGLMETRIGDGGELRPVSDHIARTAFSLADAFLAASSGDERGRAGAAEVWYPRGMLERGGGGGRPEA